MVAPPNITSFVIRFVEDFPDEVTPSFRIHIRHVQTSRECNFSLWSEAVAFMQAFLPVAMDTLHSGLPTVDDLNP